MNGKLSNIGKWVFAVLAVVTVGLALYFYLDLKSDTRTSVILNWGYIMIVLGIVFALAMPIVSSFVKKPNVKKLLIALVSIVVIAVVAYIISRVPYEQGTTVYSAKTNGWVEFGLNFFYVTLVASIIAILYSVIRSGK
mgnify:CR=1 FL=1